MNIQQTNDLLVLIQVIDNRQVGDATVLSWHELVDDLDFDLAVAAMRLHFRESTEYLKPAHIRQGIERMLRAGLGTQEDEFGNEIEPDPPALAAYERVTGARQEITS